MTDLITRDAAIDYAMNVAVFSPRASQSEINAAVLVLARVDTALRADLAAVPAQVEPDCCDICRGKTFAETADGKGWRCVECKAIWLREPQPDQTAEIDIRSVFMEEIEKATAQSPWVPKEYTMNEVVSDCCAFLREDRSPQPDPRDEVIARLVEALEEGRRAIGEHFAPHDCYATGPLTGDAFRDLVQCPACSFIESHDAALAAAKAVQHD